MIEILQVVAIIALVLMSSSVVVWVFFALLNYGHSQPKQEERKPDAWRIKHGNRYYYMDKTEPFPTQDAEPLYLGKK